MKASQPELCVGLAEKMERTLRHWATVDEVLPPAYPLVLLEDADRMATAALVEQLHGLREVVRRRKLEVSLALGAYKQRKAAVHEWVRAIYQWVRGLMQGTEWTALVRRVPGRGQAFQFWWEAAWDALSMWQKMTEDPPPIPVGWPMDLGRSRTVEEFAEVVHALEAAHRALGVAEMNLKLARSALGLAQKRATALLMAYGHGVRARLGQTGALVRLIPRLWPKRSSAANLPSIEASAGDNRPQAVLRRDDQSNDLSITHAR